MHILIYLGLEILGFVMSKEDKLLDLKKIEIIFNMPTLQRTPMILSFQWVNSILLMFCEKFCIIVVPITKFMQKLKPNVRRLRS
jgi:hypothetical protein